MFIEEKQLKQFIADSGLVSKRDIAESEKEAESKKVSVGEVLVNQGRLSEDDLRKIQSYVLGIPFVDLRSQKIDFDVLSLIPEPIARKNNIIAFKKNAETLEVAMLDTDSLSTIEFIKKKVGLKIFPRLTGSESIKSALVQYQKGLKTEFGDIIRKETLALKSLPKDNPRKLADDVSVIRVVDTLLKHAIVQNASDVHVEPLEKDLLVRYRIDGALHDAMVLPKGAETPIVARIKMLAGLKFDERDLPQDGRFKVEMNDERVSLRVSILPTFYGEKTVLRLLRENVSGFTLEHLGFHGEALEHLHDVAKFSSGMVLVTGPADSGKSTSLYTLLDILNTPDVNVATIEDPVEYQMPRVNQTQVRPEIGLSFSSGLRSLLRQDPDVIMVGEIRDSETASLSAHAAFTGHVLLSALPADSAAGAISGLLSMKVEPFLIASTLSVIINQRLVRKLDESKDRRALSKAELSALGKVVDLDRMLGILRNGRVIGSKDGWDNVMFGSAKATATSDGYKGRIGIHEVLKISGTVKELITRGSSSVEIEERAKKEGMITLLEDGLFAAAQGLTTVEEVLRAVSR